MTAVKAEGQPRLWLAAATAHLDAQSLVRARPLPAVRRGPPPPRSPAPSRPRAVARRGQTRAAVVARRSPLDSSGGGGGDGGGGGHPSGHTGRPNRLDSVLGPMHGRRDATRYCAARRVARLSGARHRPASPGGVGRSAAARTAVARRKEGRPGGEHPFLPPRRPPCARAAVGGSASRRPAGGVPLPSDRDRSSWNDQTPCPDKGACPLRRECPLPPTVPTSRPDVAPPYRQRPAPLSTPRPANSAPLCRRRLTLPKTPHPLW